MLRRYKKGIVVLVVLFSIQFFIEDAQANRDGVYCRGTQGYMYAVATDYSCTARGMRGDPYCPYTGRHYSGSPKACTAGERVCVHHFCNICPTCTPPPPPCKISCTGDQLGTCCNQKKECSCVFWGGIRTSTCVDK